MLYQADLECTKLSGQPLNGFREVLYKLKTGGLLLKYAPLLAGP